MLNILTASILGAIEGLTEFLPVSSTAHLILASRLLNISSTEFLKTFEIAVQSGAILSVVVLFWKKFFNPEILKKIIIAFIPTGFFGFILYGFVKNFLLENISVILISLSLGGIFLIFFELFYKKNKEVDNPPLPVSQDFKEISYKNCFIIGSCQALAMIPGVSRSAATIIGGLSLKIPRAVIVEFSFLLAVPTMFAATFYDILKTETLLSSSDFSLLLVGLFVSFLTAALSIKFLLNYVRRHSFIPFGIYRLLLVFLFVIFFI